MIETVQHRDDDAIDELVALLVACVDAGASVSFMAPLAPQRAHDFWRGVLDSAARGERIVLVARDAQGVIVGTVQVITAQPDNQPHRADVAKMLVHPNARRQGLGEALMRAAEVAAQRAGKTLLVLDTASDVAARLYARCGWTEVGTIPDYALWPNGGVCPTTIFYRRLTAHIAAS